MLDAIEAALAAGDRAAALRAALTAWRACRAKPLAKLIDALTEARPAPELWEETASLGDPMDVARLVVEDERLVTLIERGPDPRLGAALIAFAAAQKYPAGTKAGLWNVVWRAIPQMLGASAREALAAIELPTKPAEFRKRYGGWLRETIEALPAEAKLAKGDAARVKAMIARAKLLPAKLAKAPVETSAARAMVTPWTVALERAVAAAAARDWEVALDLALDAWTPSRDPILGDLVVAIGAQHDVPPVAKAEWLAVEARGRALDVPRLLVVAFEPFQDRRLALRRPDPRIGRAADELGVTDADRWAARMAMRAQHGDADALADIVRWAAGTVDAHTARHFPTHRPRKRAAEAVVAGLVTLAPLAPDERAIAMDALDRVRAALPARAAHPEAAFVADILAHPDDDGPRLVYADYLTEKGDRWGELITVQCALARAPADRKLLARNQKLIHPFRDVVVERGMVVSFAAEHAPLSLDHPRLGTAASIGTYRAHDEVLALFDANPMPALRHVGDASFNLFCALAMRARPIGIESIETNLDYQFRLPEEDRARVAAGRGLPALRTLQLSLEEAAPLWLFGGALAERLERVVLRDNHRRGRDRACAAAIRERGLAIEIVIETD